MLGNSFLIPQNQFIPYYLSLLFVKSILKNIFQLKIDYNANSTIQIFRRKPYLQQLELLCQNHQPC